jgi:DNA-3-methyladenine glycosylase II
MTKVYHYPQHAYDVLFRDEKLAAIIQRYDPVVPVPETDMYLHLLRAIIGQQLSTKVARVINERFRAMFPEFYPLPEMIREFTDEEFRRIGLSGQKTGYVRNVAEFKLAGELEYEHLVLMQDEELIKHLTRIKGVGRWTSEMILMFPLDRPDVFPQDDLGIQNAMIRAYGITATGKALKVAMQHIAVGWAPYRSLACKYLWKSLDNQ